MITKIEKQSKLEALVLHFANSVPLNLGRKKLAKLLYFVDFTNFELKEKSLTGLNYQKYRYGPVPFNYSNVLGLIEDKGYIKCLSQENEYSPALIKPTKQPDYSVFSKDEKELIDMITDKYKLSTAKELETIAQSEPPYKMTEFDEEIPYHLSFYRNTFEEMDLEYDEDTQ